ncbi:hypothetical protein MCOR03_002956 [Pyricularia oryzae]|uniref:alpha-1,2-Mannosidase n=1 Tax=Pyricularia grisea TaxID=148305 RepID=A0ABQ8NQF8_PYRGI|nr:hypothetical protein MCOR01_000314 [Pyricularia oryzae]KAI6299326.1 hypothetical protein MCOR33_004742 [Pyricularia grisea]KAI6273114.1 hypothetical protein MCOR26_007033 [Pyricularia oryzae]KAI6332538.1 hypothetical protein MCOR30_004514 [Pyricularia oryzae]KAI6343924.1 hypothetical protein MCOR28_004492 [Pyricularia oryzae]
MAYHTCSIFKRRPAVFFLLIGIFFLISIHRKQSLFVTETYSQFQAQPDFNDGNFHWANVPLNHPISPQFMTKIPSTRAKAIPKIQHAFKKETPEQRKVRLARLEQVRSNFTHAWSGYKKFAWLHDEVLPVTGGERDVFGGWAATLVDSLDSLYIMGLTDDFDEAVQAVIEIDFTKTSLDEINVFETTIRYLGGLLAAYDISGGRRGNHATVLLHKAIELGDMLYVAFDTPNHMPILRWKLKALMDAVKAPYGGLNGQTQGVAADGQKRLISPPNQAAPDGGLIAEIGSLTLEFTRLSQITGNPKYFDAVQRIMDLLAKQQDDTRLPGMWPVVIGPSRANFREHTGFSIGGMADSVYEYLPKEYILLSGKLPQYQEMYTKALGAMKRNIFYRPRITSPYGKEAPRILLPGDIQVEPNEPLLGQEPEPRVQHLGCFAGGMVALAARAFSTPQEMDTARQLVEGCMWAYEHSPGGIMPEVMHTTRCPRRAGKRSPATADADDLDHIPPCAWDEDAWHADVAAHAELPADDVHRIGGQIAEQHLVPGVVRYDDRRYILRPEAVESVFVLYRTTGDRALLDRAWAMFETIVRLTKTDIAHAALADCTVKDPKKSNSMESFWLAETLKYFFLLYSEPDVVSLDEYVLNTEAHPLRIAK